MAKAKKIVDVSNLAKEGDEVVLKNGKTIKEGKEPKSGWRRALAITSWILAIASEVCAILYLVGKINITSLNQTTWLIIFIAIDLIFFVIGSLLWKKANHITPKSEKNKFSFWVWNNLGTILSVLAFLPLIIFVLMNKDMDKKSKGNIIGYYNKLIQSSNTKKQLEAINEFGWFERICGSMRPEFACFSDACDKELASNRIYIHYAANNFFLKGNDILKNINKIKDIKTIIIHNRLDLICPFKGAYDLHKNMNNSELIIVDEFGHVGNKLRKTIVKKLNGDLK